MRVAVTDTDRLDLSVVIPFLNEEESIGLLCEKVAAALDPMEVRAEVILVDDGSTDQTFARAAAIADRDPRFRVIQLRRNFGQTAALSAGIRHARGEVIVTMDGDLQNDPRDIETLLDKMHEGYDVVIGWREQRQDKLITRKIPSILANGLIRWVMGTQIRDNGCALRAYRADLLQALPLYSEMHRLLPTIMTLSGARLAQVKVRHHSRQYGASKYGLSRIYKVLMDLLALKSVLGLVHLPFFGFGAAAVLFGLGAGLGFVVMLLYLVAGLPIVVMAGVTLLLSALSLFMLMLGMLSELIYRQGPLKLEHTLKITTVAPREGRAPVHSS
ncbi:glycosyltransferase [Rhodothermaceae bacterium RA]|nr:glycosyltransferase [Rhodothermaceae bacterium RA]